MGQASVPASPNMEDFSIYRRRLPHWRLDGATYFVTWRLQPGLAPLLPAERQVIYCALMHFDGERYDLNALVVLDDHIHVLVRPIDGHPLKSILHSWKSFTAHRLQLEFHRIGRIWQDESFDRIVRDDAEFLEKATYIVSNPSKRWPELTDYPWVYTKTD